MRFAGISDEDLFSFVHEQDNVNTKKTDRNVSLFRDLLREVWHMGGNFQDFDPAELNMHVASFILNVKRQVGQDYEPTIVRGFVSSMDRYLLPSKYPYSILERPEFSTARDALKAKLARWLKKKKIYFVSDPGDHFVKTYW